MSYFDDASLVMIPSGYKTSKVYSVKPTDGSGDLTFTRSNDTATRVGPDGLIEKVRTNLILQSETFDNAYWTKAGGSSVTANSVANPINGAITADTLTVATTQYSGLYGAVTGSGNFTQSIYAKKNTIDFLYFFNPGGTIIAAWFNLANGTVGQVTGGYSANIESVGNGWYRCSIRNTASESNNYLQIGLSSTDGSDIPSAAGSAYIFGAQSEFSDFGATPYIATTTAAVSVGPVANVPRLDYLNSSCPRLLLEPQRTNITLYSEQMNNAAWAATNCTVSANAVTSPDGYTNADNISTTAANSYFAPVAAVTISADASTYTQSIFVKWVSGSEVVKLRAALTGGTSVAKETIANIRTGVITSTDTTAQIVSYGNGWYRISQQVTNNSTNTNFNYQFYPTNDGTNTNVISLWGAMAEVGSYVTSYIPTLGSASTRGSDAASKTGISSLIGQTEGTIFVDFVMSNNATDIVPFDIAGSDGKLIWIRNTGAQFYGNGTTLIANIGIAAGTQGTRYKIAFVYGQNDFRLYRNGSLIGTDTSGTFTGTFSDIALNSVINQANGFNQVLLFKTKLTNAQLAELTTL